jgi:signal transduction histidine kinase
VKLTSLTSLGVTKVEQRAHLFSLVRLLLAAGSLLALSYTHATPISLTITNVLIFYCIYAALQYAWPKAMFKLVPKNQAYWFDFAWLLLMISIIGGFATHLFVVLFFAIVVASYFYGTLDGIRITIAIALLCGVIAFLVPTFNAKNMLFPALCCIFVMLVLDGLIAYWGGLVEQQKRQLKLLSQLNTSTETPLGSEEAMAHSLSLIREFYRAYACMAVMKTPDNNFAIFKVVNDPKKQPLLGQQLDESIAKPLFKIPSAWSLFFGAGEEWHITSLLANNDDENKAEQKAKYGEDIAQMLEADSFASVPLNLDGAMIGRLFLINCNKQFNASDLDFLQQLDKQITPYMSHIYLTEKVSNSATSNMRKKISIDLHDSTIQPYIGLKLGLEALRRKIGNNHAIAAEIDDLVQMTGESITELRQYIGNFKVHLEGPLLPAVIDIAEKYHNRYGINVAVHADPELNISEQLSSEIYQLVCEGLSNIHRHTAAKHAGVNIYRQHDQIIVQVVNQDDGQQEFIAFRPQSISERVAHLGGVVKVDHDASGKTTVMAKIPLQTKDMAYANLA